VVEQPTVNECRVASVGIASVGACGGGRPRPPGSAPIPTTCLKTRIHAMRSHVLSLTFQFTAIACFIVSANPAKAQDTPSSISREGDVTLTKLSLPTYPPLARQARIAGDVKIQVLIRRDGSVASAVAVSGHPMLKPTALASAQNSTFECRRCTEDITSYSLTYTFGFNNDSNCSLKRSRSAKCLYLWSCGDWRRVYHDLPSPSITQSQGHITILTGSVCWES
jgi:TonB family protein